MIPFLFVQINTDASDAEYGKTTVFNNQKEAPDAPCITFVVDLDTALYWDFVTDLICHMENSSTHAYSYFEALLAA